jgi:hypothetical protein
MPKQWVLSFIAVIGLMLSFVNNSFPMEDTKQALSTSIKKDAQRTILFNVAVPEAVLLHWEYKAV